MNKRTWAMIASVVGLNFALTAADEKPVQAPAFPATITVQPSTNVVPAGVVPGPAAAGDPGPAENLKWSSANVGLRPTPEQTVVAPRPVKVRTPLDKTMPADRKGFRGFAAGFLQLFNPFAPLEAGTSAQNVHWYDSQLNSAALPRGFRDERTHEPQAVLVSIGR